MFTPETTRWVMGGLFAFLWVAIAASNWRAWWQARRTGGSTSLTLFMGGFFGVLAALVLPLAGSAYWAWVPAVLDPGSLPAAIQMWRTRRPAGPPAPGE